MSKQGNIGGVLREAGFETLKALKALGRRLGVIEDTFGLVVKNASIVASHADLKDLSFTESGHTDFASSAQLETHTGNTSNPHSVDETDILPAQATHSGEFLTTDGSVSSWAAGGGGGGDYNIDGGRADSIYTAEQSIDGGSASG